MRLRSEAYTLLLQNKSASRRSVHRHKARLREHLTDESNETSQGIAPRGAAGPATSAAELERTLTAKCLSQQVKYSLFSYFAGSSWQEGVGVIGMQAPAGQLDEPGPEPGHRAQRLRCAHEMSLKLRFSNRLRPVHRG